jgi:hypothetical protein
MIMTPLEQESVIYCCNAWMGGVRHLQDWNLIHLLTLEYSSNVKSVIDERLSSFSHFKMEKSDSTDVVFGKAVASPS